MDGGRDSVESGRVDRVATDGPSSGIDNVNRCGSLLGRVGSIFNGDRPRSSVVAIEFMIRSVGNDLVIHGLTFARFLILGCTAKI